MNLSREFQNQSLSFVVLLLLLKASLDLLYVIYIVPAWPNKGFLLEPDYLRLLESWMMYAALLVFIPARLSRPSDFFVLLLLIFVLIPVLSMFALGAEPRWIAYSVLLACGLIHITRNIKGRAIPVIPGGPKSSLILSMTMLLVTICWLFVSQDMTDISFQFDELYKQRKNFNQNINHGVFAYLLSWAFKVFNLYLMAYSLHKKKWFAAIACLALQIFLFVLTGQKIVLAFDMVVLLVWGYYQKHNDLRLVPACILITIMVVSVIWYASGDRYSYPISLVVRRMFFVTANNIYDYFVFFSQNNFVFWSNSITSGLFEYPYSENYPNLIGNYQAQMLEENWEEISINRGVYANSSFIATAYMHAGITGVVFYSAVVGAICRTIDLTVDTSQPGWMVVAVMAAPLTSLLTGADLPTAILTHGVLAGIVLLVIARSPAQSY